MAFAAQRDDELISSYIYRQDSGVYSEDFPHNLKYGEYSFTPNDLTNPIPAAFSTFHQPLTQFPPQQKEAEEKLYILTDQDDLEIDALLQAPPSMDVANSSPSEQTPSEKATTVVKTQPYLHPNHALRAKTGVHCQPSRQYQQTSKEFSLLKDSELEIKLIENSKEPSRIDVSFSLSAIKFHTWGSQIEYINMTHKLTKVSTPSEAKTVTLREIKKITAATSRATLERTALITAFLQYCINNQSLAPLPEVRDILYHQLTPFSVNVSKTFCSMFIACCIEAADVASAKNMLFDMQKTFSQVPNVHVIKSLLLVYVSAGDCKSAYQLVWRGTFQKHGISYTDQIFKYLLLSYVKNREVKRAFECLKRMNTHYPRHIDEQCFLAFLAVCRVSDNTSFAKAAICSVWLNKKTITPTITRAYIDICIYKNDKNAITEFMHISPYQSISSLYRNLLPSQTLQVKQIVNPPYQPRNHYQGRHRK
ncbi:hypothetical protein D5018_08455 [Parashewanella curva]|uniref:Uncharacterized protein n=1 Tax=Parashewanella curva TaxID=2338552 RepID=A0A3L8PY23_9GAMM|nr:hypothetical protein [Parashewanella curva]RLV60155.1 hypothetical protein D5018_08455 [Parashewanella curva]